MVEESGGVANVEPEVCETCLEMRCPDCDRLEMQVMQGEVILHCRRCGARWSVPVLGLVRMALGLASGETIPLEAYRLRRGRN